MIDFGNTLSILEEDDKPNKKARYRGDSQLYQESKKDDGEDHGKYDDKYDLDDDQGTEIEPVDIELDDDEKPSKENDDKSDSDDEEDETDTKKKPKKKPKKTKKNKDDDIDDIDDESNDDEEVDFEEEGFGAGLKEELKSVPKIFSKAADRYKDYYSGRFDDIKEGIDDIKKDGLKGLLNAPIKSSVRRQDRLDDFEMQRIKDHRDIRHDVLDAYESKNSLDRAGKKAKRKIKRGVRDAVDDITEESYQYIETVTPRNPNQDIDKTQESQASENNYYSAIANSSKDLEHLYKTLLKRADKDTVVEELTGIYEDLKQLREDYFQKQANGSVYSGSHQNHSYQGMKRIIDQDIAQIDNYLEMIKNDGEDKKGGKSDKPKKINKNLVKKTIKCINNLQQDMITECERSQPRIIRHIRDIGKKLWLFESYDETSNDEVTQEAAIIAIKTTNSEDGGVFDKVGKLMIKLRKQKELQDLAEKNGLQINGMRYTDDTIMNIATSVVALMLARDEGDPRYRALCQQGMQKRSLKVELINAYKDKANDIINQYDNGPMDAEPFHDTHGHGDIEIVSDEDEVEEEYYVDPETGEMKSIYQEAKEDGDEDDEEDKDSEKDTEEDDDKESEEPDDEKDKDEDDDSDESDEDDVDDEDDDEDEDSDEDDDEDVDFEEEGLAVAGFVGSKVAKHAAKKAAKNAAKKAAKKAVKKGAKKIKEHGEVSAQEESFTYSPEPVGRLVDEGYTYQESDQDTDNGYTTQGKHGKIELDGTNLEWEVKPRIKVEDIKFGDSRDKVRDKLDDFGHPTEKNEEESSIDDYGKFQVFYNKHNKCEAVKILDNGITIEMDHSTIFPGDVSNISKKALDLKPGDAKNKTLTSRIMSVEIEVTPSNKMKSIKFARAGYFIEQQTDTFDKISWHTDKGVDETEMIKKFKEVYKFLDKHHLLSPAGKEEMKNIDSSSVLTSREVTEHGNAFLKQYYDKCINYGHKEIREKLEFYYRQFNGQSYDKGKAQDIKE